MKKLAALLCFTFAALLLGTGCNLSTGQVVVLEAAKLIAGVVKGSIEESTEGRKNEKTVTASRSNQTDRNFERAKAEYDRLKNQKKDTATTSKSETEPSGDDPLAAKLEKLKKLLEKGLITEEEAAAKRAKLLEDL